MFLQLSYQQFFRFHIHGDTAPHDAFGPPSAGKSAEVGWWTCVLFREEVYV